MRQFVGLWPSEYQPALTRCSEQLRSQLSRALRRPYSPLMDLNPLVRWLEDRTRAQGVSVSEMDRLVRRHLFQLHLAGRIVASTENILSDDLVWAILSYGESINTT